MAENYKFKSILENFIEWSGRRPGDTFSIWHGRKTSWAEADRLSDGVARAITERFGGPLAGRGVILSTERDERLPIYIFGILKAGAFYVPVGMDYPAERAAFIMKDSGAAMALCAAGSPCTDLAGGLPLLLTSEIGAPDAAEPPFASACPDEKTLMAILYTSGSTGMPKGVPLTHGLVSAGAAFLSSHMQLGPESRCLMRSPLAFLMSVGELSVSMASGASLAVLDDEQRIDILQMARAVDEYDVHAAFMVPSMLRALPEGSCASLRTVMLGGEPVTAESIRQMKGRNLVCSFGMTEGGGAMTVGLWRPGLPPSYVGKLSPFLEGKLLDDEGRPVADGERGLLWITGRQIIESYHNRPEEDVKHFRVMDGRRWFCTGDIMSRDADGTLYYSGRRDFQVKVNGQRVELGEIERRAAASGLADECAARAFTEHGRTEIVLYYTERADRAASPEELRAELAKTLPGYMMPEQIVKIDRMPRLVSGKLDRMGLQRPDAESMRPPYAEPAPGLEAELAKAFEETLGIKNIGADDDFFALGGDSLSAVRLARPLGRPLSVSAVVRGRTPRGIARQLAFKADEAPSAVTIRPARPEDSEKTIELTSRYINAEEAYKDYMREVHAGLGKTAAGVMAFAGEKLAGVAFAVKGMELTGGRTDFFEEMRAACDENEVWSGSILVVDEEFRDTGVAGELQAEMIKEIKKAGGRHIVGELWVHPDGVTPSAGIVKLAQSYTDYGTIWGFYDIPALAGHLCQICRDPHCKCGARIVLLHL